MKLPVCLYMLYIISEAFNHASVSKLMRFREYRKRVSSQPFSLVALGQSPSPPSAIVYGTFSVVKEETCQKLIIYDGEQRSKWSGWSYFLVTPTASTRCHKFKGRWLQLQVARACQKNNFVYLCRQVIRDQKKTPKKNSKKICQLVQNGSYCL